MASPTPRASITCCHVTPSHFCFFVTTFSHLCTPLCLYYTSVWSFTCPVCHHSLLTLSSQSVTRSPTQTRRLYFPILSVRLRPPFLSLPPAFAHTSVPFFFLIIGRSLFCLAQIVYVRCVLTTGNLRFWLKPVWCASFKVFEVAYRVGPRTVCTSFGNEGKRTARVRLPEPISSNFDSLL